MMRDFRNLVRTCGVLKLAAYSLLRSTLFRINVGAVDMLEHLDI